MAFVTDTDLAATGPGQGADMVGFEQDRWIGAAPRVLREKLSDVATVLDMIPAGQHAAILTRSSSYDAAPDIKRAIDQAAAEGRRLHVPTGLYNIVPGTPHMSEAGPIQTCFVLRSDMDIAGERGALFRIPNGVSTDANVVPMAIFASNQPVARILMRDLTLDLNGQNNPISPNRADGNYSLLNQPHIFVSGTPGAEFSGSIVGNLLTVLSVSSGALAVGMAVKYAGTIKPLLITALGTGSGGAGSYLLSDTVTAPSQTMAAGFAAYADDVLIENMRFLNNPGTSCVCMAQSNTLGVGLGRRWTIRNSQFLENGFDTVDHSCVYGWAQDVTIDNCMFQNGVPFSNVGMVAAYEIHGANTKFINNTVRNAYRGIWVAENNTDESSGILVANNRFDGIKTAGIELFGQSPTAPAAKRVLIADNIITLNADAHPRVSLKAGIQVASYYGQRDITIRGNRIQGTQGVASAGVVITAVDEAPGKGKHSNIDIDGNTAEGTVFGVFVRTTSTNGLGHLKITRNRLINPLPAGAYVDPMGVAIGFNNEGDNQGNPPDPAAVFAAAKPVDSLIIRGNEVALDNILAATVRGVRLAGHLSRLDYADNTTRNVQIDLEESVWCEIGERRGSFPLRTFAPTFRAGGTPITLGNGAVTGTWSMANGRVSMTAKLTVGSTTSFPAGGITVDLPIMSGFVGLQYIGGARTFDASASVFTFFASEIDGTAAIASLQVSGGTNVTATAPVALAVGDVVSMQIEYATPTA
jgi:hypothetical protein